MGGSGSTRWRGYVRKTTVEDCLTITVRDLFQDEDAVLGVSTRALRWQDGLKGAVLLTAHLTIELDRGKGLRCTIRHRTGLPSQMMAQVIPVELEPSYWGVRRWLTRPSCGRRCGKLYRPANGLFGCRGCNNLMYQGCQERNPSEQEEWKTFRRYMHVRYRFLRRCKVSAVAGP
jgi:hypothetical protein